MSRYARESLRDVLAQKKKEGRQDRRPGLPAEEFAHDRLVPHIQREHILLVNYERVIKYK